MTTRSPASPKRRGRRPGGQDTRTALLEAARAVFSESGYDGATVRGIAKRAGVDAAMVNHWFGGKESLFAEAVLELPVNPAEIVEYIAAGDVDTLGERIVHRFLTVWDSAGGQVFTALVRSITTNEQALRVMQDFFIKHVFGNALKMTGADQPRLRASLAATQMIGLGMVRYVAKFEPLASSDHDVVVAAVAPNVQRYLTGDIT